MKKMKLKHSLLALAMSAVAVCATAAEPSVSATLPPGMSAIAALEAKLHASSPSLRSERVSLDSTAAEFSKQGFEYTPIVFSGKRFLTDKSGSILLDPQSAFTVTNESIERLSDRLLKIDMAGAQDKWPSLKLADGVVKQGDLFVLTDPTCGYCQKIDEEVERYLASGIQVHYIPFPRSGVESLEQPGFARWGAAACSADPAKAYHEIAHGKLDAYPVPKDPNAECLKVVREGFDYGRKLGIGGTPFMYAVSNTGATFANPGYLPVEQVGQSIGVLIKPDAGAALLAK